MSTTTLALAAVCDLDCIVSWSPLVFDFPSTERYVTGGNAICQRVLISWALNAGILDLSGKSFEPADIAILRSQLAALAEAEDFVQSIDLTLTLDPTTNILSMVAAEVLIDGLPYALEVDTSAAATAISALGSATG